MNKKDTLVGRILEEDAKVQKLVDRAAAYLMDRLGVNRWFLLYGLQVIGLCAFVCGSMMQRGGMTVTNVCAAAFIIFWMHVLLRVEKSSGDDGPNPWALQPQQATLNGISKGFIVAFLAKDILTAIVGPWPAGALAVPGITFAGIIACELACNGAFLLMLYVVMSPKRPPPRKKKVEALVPSATVPSEA